MGTIAGPALGSGSYRFVRVDARLLHFVPAGARVVVAYPATFVQQDAVLVLVSMVYLFWTRESVCRPQEHVDVRLLVPGVLPQRGGVVVDGVPFGPRPDLLEYMDNVYRLLLAFFLSFSL